ncbi:MAG: YcgL domain-containing protein [Gammaproteobacteria bacterium]|nr:MAG: YcgL domain-containing protein [Gammaproteobacteria bacterium]
MKDIDCWIYKSPKKDEMYIYLARKDDFECVPELLRNGFGSPEFVMQLTLCKERKLAREDVRQVMNNLQSQGYHLQMPPRIEPDLYHGG